MISIALFIVDSFVFTQCKPILILPLPCVELAQHWLEFAQATNAAASAESEYDSTLNKYYDKLTEVANQISALEKELVRVFFFSCSLKIHSLTNQSLG